MCATIKQLMKHYPHKTHISTDEILKLYNSGLSCGQIGKKLEMHRVSVRKRLRKIGIHPRPSSEYIGSKRYWKGGDYIDPIIIRKYNQRKLRKWSLAVRTRDNHTCQDCGITGVRLHAHHLLRIEECINTKFEFDIDNGETLCTKCHKHRHKEQGI